MTDTRRVFLVWAPYSRRSQVLSDALGMPCLYVHYLRFKQPAYAPVKYIAQAVRTWQLLCLHRPGTIFVFNPPYFAAIVVQAYLRSVRRGSFVLDSHTAAFLDWQWRLLTPLHKLLARDALLNIVTNEHLAGLVAEWGARVYVLQNKLPSFHDDGRRWPTPDRFSLLLVSSFSADEPIGSVLEAARLLRGEVTLYVSGDSRRFQRNSPDIPENVILTGFLPDSDYVALLHSVDAVIDLTDRNHTLLDGAYEAIAAGKPLITSDWPILRHHFSKGTVFVDNSPNGIVTGIRKTMKESAGLRRAVEELREDLEARWQGSFLGLQAILDQAEGKQRSAPVDVPRGAPG